jgi:general secretion pathway protein G
MTKKSMLRILIPLLGTSLFVGGIIYYVSLLQDFRDRSVEGPFWLSWLLMISGLVLTFSKRKSLGILYLILLVVFAFSSKEWIRKCNQGKRHETMIYMYNIQEALDFYKIRNHAYPTTEEGLNALVDKKIIKVLQNDAWGNPLQYERTGPRSFVLKSLCSDGKEGGIEWNEDLVLNEKY